MNKLIPALLLNAIATLGYAQTFRVIAGDDPLKALPVHARYRYPEFQDGYLYYANDEQSVTRKLNYNIFVNELRYLDAEDTLTVLDADAVTYVKIGRDFYYHDIIQGYFEILSFQDDIKLLMKQELKMLRREMVENNGYTQTVSIANNYAASKYSSRSTNGHNIQNEDVVYSKRSNFFLLDQRRNILHANRAGFVQAFAPFREQVIKYLKQNIVDFDSESDVRKLLEYCGQF